MHLRTHTVELHGDHIHLRPLTEDDWPFLYRWNNDPEILYFLEGDRVESRSLDELHAIYRTISHSAFCFLIERFGHPIGECWLQQMNLERILTRYASSDCRRIDLAIGEKVYWKQGIGTEVLQLLTEFAFLDQHADYVFGCDIADYNAASLRAFQKVGYQIVGTYDQPSGAKASHLYDVALAREQYEQQNNHGSSQRTGTNGIDD